MSKKIAIVTPVFPPYRGGIGNVAFNQARVLARRGCEITVLTPDYNNTAPNHPLAPFPRNTRDRLLVKEGEFTLELLKPVLKYGNAAWAPSLKKRLGSFSAKGGPASGWNVVILQYPFFGGMRAVYRAKKKYNFKLIVNYNMDVVGGGFKGFVFWYATRFFLPRIIKIADIVCASSEDYALHSALGKYWDNNQPKFKIIPNGVDVNRFAFSNEERERMALFVGGLDKAHYFKGVEYLIKAMSLVRHPERNRVEVGQRPTEPSFGGSLWLGSQGFPRDPSAAPQDDGGPKVIVVGKGELMWQYQKLAQELGVDNIVEFAGGVADEELVRLYQKSAVTVLPSIDQSEAFGIVLVESMSCGTPVIASDLPGVRSVFQDGISGFAVPPRDVGKLAERLQYAFNNPERMREMGAAGRKLVEERYDWQEIGDKLLKLVEN